MPPLNSLLSRINSVDQSTFEQVAIEVFNFQATNNLVFHQYLNSLGHSGKAQSMEDFVFMPIEFFKNHTIKTGEWKEETVFESSGTTGNAIRHTEASAKEPVRLPKSSAILQPAVGVRSRGTLKTAVSLGCQMPRVSDPRTTQWDRMTLFFEARFGI